jgi:cbb3-type cytochrome c oxidase subunit III
MQQRVVRVCAVVGLSLVALAAIGCGQAPTAGIAGRDLYRACESCHGATGAGNAGIGAPPLAGLPEWYVASQLQRFQSGLRGKHPDDAEGLRMRAMSLQMFSKAEIDAVASHISQMPRAPKNAPSLAADARAGQPFYAVCGACHGAAGEGNQQLNAPPLAHFDDWYIARQLRKFQTGVRGRIAEDAIGQQMSGMAMTVPAEQVDAVAAYVHSLSK